MAQDKEIRSDAKLKNLAPSVLEDLWRFRNPEEGGTKLSYEEILVWLLKVQNVESSMGALSYFYKWLRLDRRWGSYEDTAEQAKAFMAKDPDASLDEVEEFGQFVFSNETIENGDTLNFVRLRKIRLQEKLIKQSERKLVMLEAKEKRLDAMEAKAKELKAGGGLSPETMRVLEQDLKLL